MSSDVAARQFAHCLRCGAAVEDPQVARVVGDNDGNVEVCRKCYECRDDGNGTIKTTTQAVCRYRRRNGGSA